MLCVASRSFSKVSESFIRAHTQVLPGRTVLICEDNSGTDMLSAHVLGGISLGLRRWTLGERLHRIAKRQRVAADGIPENWVLPDGEEERILQFLKLHGVHTILVEYGNVAVRLMRVAQKSGCKFFVHFHGYDGSRLL